VSLSNEELREWELALGKAFRLLREHRSLSRAEVAARAGMDEVTLASIEDGSKTPLSFDTMGDLTAKGLEVRFGEVGHLVDQYLGRT
jgi:transcriptional regulator with XRE-family HTH domain